MPTTLFFPPHKEENSLGSGIWKGCPRPQSPKWIDHKKFSLGLTWEFATLDWCKRTYASCIPPTGIIFRDRIKMAAYACKPVSPAPSQSRYIFNILITLVSGEENSVAWKNQSEKATSLNMLLFLFKVGICKYNTIQKFKIKFK